MIIYIYIYIYLFSHPFRIGDQPLFRKEYGKFHDHNGVLVKEQEPVKM